MNLPRVTIPSTNLVVSAFCYGTARWRLAREENVRAIYAQFREAGGDVLDSAHNYAFWDNATGEPERLIGKLLEGEKRSDVVVLTKGGHYGGAGYVRPARYCSPEMIRSDIRDSLERMQIDCIDLFLLHRDDTRVSVTEYIDALAEEVSAGRIRYFGGSNWTRERFSAANRYAKRVGKPGFVASQPLWNLAHLIPPDNWDHTRLILSDDQAEIAWYEENRFPALPFSPTAEGLFGESPRVRPEYDNDTTHRRMRACKELAKEVGATPNQVALAWLRQHSFPVIPILGTLNPDHLTDALASINVTLTADQLVRLV